MGAFLDKPKTEKYNESKNGGGLKYGLSSMQVQIKLAYSKKNINFDRFHIVEKFM